MWCVPLCSRTKDLFYRVTHVTFTFGATYVRSARGARASHASGADDKTEAAKHELSQAELASMKLEELVLEYNHLLKMELAKQRRLQQASLVALAERHSIEEDRVRARCEEARESVVDAQARNEAMRAEIEQCKQETGLCLCRE